VGTPRAGVFAERQASVVADQLIARLGRGPGSTYDGKGICYIEFGHDRVARVEVTILAGQQPNGQFDEPSTMLLADKAEFGISRVRRWFNRDWRSY
jgi:sulfide:quinone oxidoreductase